MSIVATLRRFDCEVLYRITRVSEQLQRIGATEISTVRTIREFAKRHVIVGATDTAQARELALLMACSSAQEFESDHEVGKVVPIANIQAESPVSAPLYDETYLNYYADSYVAHRLIAHGISLLQYLADPERYEQFLLEDFPLLPRQEALQNCLDSEADPLPVEAEVNHLPRRNGVIVEALHHCRHPKTTKSNFARRPS